MAVGTSWLAKARKTLLFKRAAATLCHFKGETARRDRLVTEIAMDRLQAYATRHGQHTALFKPQEKFRVALTAVGSGTHWVGMVNQPSEFQKRGVIAAAKPIQEQLRLDGIEMQLTIVNGGRFGFTGRTPASLEASFRPLAAAQGAASAAPLRHG